MNEIISITPDYVEVFPSSLEERIEARVRSAMRVIDGNMSDQALIQRLHNYERLTELYRNYYGECDIERCIDALVMYLAYKRIAEARGLPTDEEEMV